jgi:hypothetical protein
MVALYEGIAEVIANVEKGAADGAAIRRGR